jgi:hypothetical protein
MTIVNVRHIEDCFDGSYMYEILFDAEITQPFIRSLGAVGQLQYYESFARPYFRAVFPNQFTVKGVEGQRTVRVTAYDSNMEPVLGLLRELAEE